LWAAKIGLSPRIFKAKKLLFPGAIATSANVMVPWRSLIRFVGGLVLFLEHDPEGRPFSRLRMADEQQSFVILFDDPFAKA
jgi:hypothetical protein